MSASPDDDPQQRLREARERLAELRAERRNGETRRDDTAARGVGTSDEERVRATASRGRLVALELDARTMRRSPEELGAHIAAAVNAALEDLAGRSADETPPVTDPAALVGALRDVQEQGMRGLALINESLAEASVRIRARM
ncbi:hypothetical protein ACGFNU_46360 [Spirillospora sp. NPDC048911]|uniref:hypothetical protein n=1 Tax=Spirillospora sp. NPDC048911 TaxID=3364527 RepID=UPI003723AAAD